MLKVEICVTSPAGIEAAVAAGADRVELCRDLTCGGVTADDELIQRAMVLCAQAGVGLRLLVRSISHGFTHSVTEAGDLVQQLRRLHLLTKNTANLDVGFVVGALTERGGVDRGFLRQARQAAGDCPLVFHRAIDAATDYKLALEQVAEAGFDAVLTTGGNGASADVAGLSKAREVLGSRCKVIGSGGLRASNIAEVIRKARLEEVHFRAPTDSPDETNPHLAKAITRAARSL
ncbi:MAG: copper homeostasis protein CutC [Actinomycetaceae bacterium]|nr:copper homeostasis protein CutC [Actinomycetaceae bacterium]